MQLLVALILGWDFVKDVTVTNLSKKKKKIEGAWSKLEGKNVSGANNG